MSRSTQRTRREFLAGTTAFAAGFGGCVSGAARESPVSMLVAGSLFDAVENGLRPALDVPLRVTAHGSAHLARLVAAGKRTPNVVSVSDVSLFDAPLAPGWYAEFATNAIVLAYDPDASGGKRIATAGRDEWYRPLLHDDVRLGRTDPDLDPLGYRTLFALELATDYYDARTDLRQAVPEREQIYPETRLASAFEAGAVEAAFLYRSTAVDRGYDFLDLPAAIDLSDPGFTDRYAQVSYELPGSETVRGDVISYAATARGVRESVVGAFERHVTGEYLTEFGFTVPEGYPRYTGSVPAAIR